MKGIIHIFEIVIVALVMFIALFQFTYIPRMEADWPRTKLYLEGWDILFTLDENGVNWLDPSEVQSEIRDILNKTNIQFGVKVKGVPPSGISVGCICSSSEMTTLQNILTNLNLNGESIRFDVSRIRPSNISFSHRHDVIFLWDYDIGAHRAEILNFLEEGKGIVEVRDLTSGDIDPVQSDIFGLVWNNSLNPNTNNIFFTSSTATPESYTVYKYFHHIPNSSGQTYPKPYYFQNFLSSGERVWQKDNDTKRIAMMQENSGTPACIINHGVSGGFGRTAWLSGLDSLEEDERVLIKSLILWAAGDEFDVVESDILTSVAKLSFFKVLDQDMYQPIEIELTLGYLY